MTGHIEGASGLIISKPWRLDDHEQNPDHNLVVDWVDTEQDAGLTTAEASDIIVSVNGKSFTDLDALYAYLAAHRYRLKRAIWSSDPDQQAVAGIASRAARA